MLNQFHFYRPRSTLSYIEVLAYAIDELPLDEEHERLQESGFEKRYLNKVVLIQILQNNLAK